MDPAIYEPGREVTVTGTHEGSSAGVGGRGARVAGSIQCRPVRALLFLLLAAGPAGGAVHDLAPVASFHYQLQDIDVAAASSSPFPLLVTDYSHDGTGATELTPAEGASLESGGRKGL